MPTLYTKVSPENMPYLDALATSAGISKAQVVDLIISEARTRGWAITVTQHRITQPRNGPGRSSPPAGTSTTTPEG
jgi:hypothetical protein